MAPPMPRIGEKGAAYYCQEFQGYSAVKAPLSNYDGEVVAINSAAFQLENCINPAKAVFLVDSQVAHSKTSPVTLKLIVRELLITGEKLNYLLVFVWTLKFQWIPSHVNISGNEMADRLEKQGTALPQPKQPSMLHSAKSQIKLAVERWNCQRLQRLSLDKNWEILVHTYPVQLV
ncbi:hypothetical protein TNCT_644471 [Trichonephila clavata]|uniref:RNase H type-1 domain-containing protein n=1 Tax=Trichonephila clavata TaxID=2740835 RepID=A0A8X6F6Y0_TRICU|nr:hypothetical protein TNCT_644471 [Trichonephila clavata]